MRRTCVGVDRGANASRQLLRDLDRLPQGTKDVFLVASSGADSRLHFEIKFGLSELHVVCGIILHYSTSGAALEMRLSASHQG